MDELDDLVDSLMQIRGVLEVAIADETGTYAAGNGGDNPEEFAAILAFVHRAGVSVGDALGADDLEFVRLSGRKHRIVVGAIPEYSVGVKIALDAVMGMTQNKIKKVVSDFIFNMEDA